MRCLHDEIEIRTDDTQSSKDHLAVLYVPFCWLCWVTPGFAELEIKSVVVTSKTCRDDADKAVCIAILRANGKGDAAKELAKSVQIDRLLPVEADLLEYPIDRAP